MGTDEDKKVVTEITQKVLIDKLNEVLTYAEFIDKRVDNLELTVKPFKGLKENIDELKKTLSDVKEKAEAPEVKKPAPETEEKKTEAVVAEAKKEEVKEPAKEEKKE